MRPVAKRIKHSIGQRNLHGHPTLISPTTFQLVPFFLQNRPGASLSVRNLFTFVFLRVLIDLSRLGVCFGIMCNSFFVFLDGSFFFLNCFVTLQIEGAFALVVISRYFALEDQDISSSVNPP